MDPFNRPDAPPNAEEEILPLVPASPSAASSVSCMHPKRSPVVYKYGTECDMIIIVGKERCEDEQCSGGNNDMDAVEFHVNAACIAGISTAFAFTVMSPTFRFRNPDWNKIAWHVTLPKDSPYAMKIIFDILYGRYPAEPTDARLTLDKLFDIIVLANKHNFIQVCKPFTGKWVRDMQRYWVGRKFIGKSTEDLEILVWIFWVLGHQPLYSYMILLIAFHTKIDVQGRLTDPSGKLCFTSQDIPVPPMAPLEIGHMRFAAIKRIRAEIVETLEEHLRGSPSSSCVRRDGEDDRAYRKSVIGHFVRMLQAEHLWPVPTCRNFNASPMALLEMFRANPNIPAFEHSGNNSFCNPVGQFWKRAQKILAEIRFPATGATLVHLKRAASESGLHEHLQPRGMVQSPYRSNWNIVDIQRFEIVLSYYTLAQLGEIMAPQPWI